MSELFITKRHRQKFGATKGSQNSLTTQIQGDKVSPKHMYRAPNKRNEEPLKRRTNLKSRKIASNRANANVVCKCFTISAHCFDLFKRTRRPRNDHGDDEWSSLEPKISKLEKITRIPCNSCKKC